MRGVKELLSLHRDARRAPRTIYVGSHEDKLSGALSLAIKMAQDGKARGKAAA